MRYYSVHSLFCMATYRSMNQHTGTQHDWGSGVTRVELESTTQHLQVG